MMNLAKQLKGYLLSGIRDGIQGKGAMIADDTALEFYNEGVEIGVMMRRWRQGVRTQPQVVEFINRLIERSGA